MRNTNRLASVTAVLGLAAAGVAAAPHDAKAWWRGGYGVGIWVPPIVVAPPPVYYPPPPVAYVPPRVSPTSGRRARITRHPAAYGSRATGTDVTGSAATGRRAPGTESRPGTGSRPEQGRTPGYPAGNISCRMALMVPPMPRTPAAPSDGTPASLAATSSLPSQRMTNRSPSPESSAITDSRDITRAARHSQPLPSSRHRPRLAAPAGSRDNIATTMLVSSGPR
jgi:hypothetical protein